MVRETSSNDLEGVLEKALGSFRVVEKDPDLGFGGSNRPELLLKLPKGFAVVEAKSHLADLDAVGQLLVYREALAKSRGVSPNTVLIILAAPRITPAAYLALVNSTGRFVTWNAPRSAERTTPGKVSITTPRAWTLITHLLGYGPESLHHASMETGVAYAWAYRVATHLMRRGVMERERSRVKIANNERLLDAVAWERPFHQLRVHTFQSRFRDPLQAAREITRKSERPKTDVSFTGWTAGAIYTRYARAFKVAQCYATSTEDVVDIAGHGQGVQIEVYSPDRSVFETSHGVRGVRVVSPSVCLLDLAGMGYSARDLALAMVRDYAKIEHSSRE